MILQPHIICIFEIKIKDTPLSCITIPEYTFLCVNSISNAGGAGMYIFNLLQFRQLTCETFSGCENLWIKISCPGADINYVVKAIY